MHDIDSFIKSVVFDLHFVVVIILVFSNNFLKMHEMLTCWVGVKPLTGT